MKLTYFYKSNDDFQSGINKKVIAQISSLIKLGVQAKGVMVIHGNVQPLLPKFFTVISLKELPINDFFGRVKRARAFSKILAETITSLGSSDILYFRSLNSVIFFYPLNYLKRFRKCILVTEHQTIESREWKLNGNYLAFFFDCILGKFIRKQSDVIVGVTDEITQYEIIRAGNLEKPHLTIGNGFEIKSVPLKGSRSFDNIELNLLCVANVSRWHGLDRILRGLAIYSGTPRVILHIAGNGSELPHLQKLANDLGIADHVLFHGFLTGKTLDDLFDQCPIAVGSLGIHRKGLTETSILKAREYCARGIPYVIACIDPDFPVDFPWVLRDLRMNLRLTLRKLSDLPKRYAPIWITLKK